GAINGCAGSCTTKTKCRAFPPRQVRSTFPPSTSATGSRPGSSSPLTKMVSVIKFERANASCVISLSITFFLFIMYVFIAGFYFPAHQLVCVFAILAFQLVNNRPFPQWYTNKVSGPADHMCGD